MLPVRTAATQRLTVRLVATDPAAVIDVPHFCAEGGHELISVEPSEPGARAFIVRRA